MVKKKLTSQKVGKKGAHGKKVSKAPWGGDQEMGKLNFHWGDATKRKDKKTASAWDKLQLVSTGKIPAR